MQKLGLIAGNRRFPLIFSEAAKKRNCYIVAVAVKGDTDARLKRYVDVALAMALAIGGQTMALWPIGSQTTALWLVFPEDLEEAAEMLAEA